jgi:hypothetical protein
MAVAKTLEDIITEQAPIVCEQIERAGFRRFRRRSADRI